MGSPFDYHPEVIEALEVHGVRPTPATDPSKTYDLLKSIYTFQVRDMRLRRQEMERVLGPQPLEPYRRELSDLLERYRVLRIPAHHWVRLRHPRV